MTATQTLSRHDWIPASVGYHWSQGPYTISTQSGGGQPSGYVVQWGFSQIGERYPTFSAAKMAAERHARQTPKQTATVAYAERFATCQALINQFQARLDAHQARQAQDPKNWGHAGDLAHYAQVLCDMLDTLPKAEEESADVC